MDNASGNIKPLADYISATKNCGVALIAYAEAETNLCLATLPSGETGRFSTQLDLADAF